MRVLSLFSLSLSLFLLTLGLALAGWVSRAEAQSFLYNPLNGSRTITIDFNSDREWFTDPWSSPPGYGANLHERIRVVGNPFLRTLALRFATFWTNATTVGGLADSLTLRWTNTTAGQAVAAGMLSPFTTRTLSAASTNSLMSPGALMVFRTGPAWSGSGTFIESEADGFVADRLTVTGVGTPQASSVTTLVPHERVMGVLVGGGTSGGDTVDFRLPVVSGGLFTVQLWLENPDTWDVMLWARCGALPTATAYAHNSNTAPASTYPGWSGATLDLPACASGWFITVTSTSAVDRVFHLTWGVHANDSGHELGPLRIGVAFNATATERATIRAAFQRAAWFFHAITGGVWAVRDFRLINNSGCMGAWPADQFACEGVSCRFCLRNETRAEGCISDVVTPTGMIRLCRGRWSEETAIVHEMAHSFIGVWDEYETGSCPTLVTTCSPSMMGGYNNNIRSFCTPLNHRTSLDIWTGSGGMGPVPNHNGPNAYDCSGGAHWPTRDLVDVNPAWDHINVHHAPLDMPSDWTPHNQTLTAQFGADPRFGWFSLSGGP